MTRAARTWYAKRHPCSSIILFMIGLMIIPPSPVPARAMLIARPCFSINQFFIIMLKAIKDAPLMDMPISRAKA